MIQPLVSIITIVYNGEKYVEQAILSVLHQSYRNIEYIIVDGGSTDNTISIINHYREKVHKFISEKDRGISDAFNKGIKMASGTFIGILNADDWYEKNAIEMVIANGNQADIIYGDLRLWNNDEVDFIVKGDHALLEHEMTLNHPTVFVRKTCYENLGLFDESFKCAMDYDMLLRLKVNGSRFVHVPHVLANMRWGGFSDAKWMMGVKETLAIKNKYLANQKFLNQLYFYKHILAIAIPKFLTRIRLHFIVKMYRSRFSKMKKSYH
ncbi:MAG: glycosyltransferase [Chitinophagaceae bacterium]|nr:glycosyltransferase [Chitinophagaceae bacterium]